MLGHERSNLARTAGEARTERRPTTRRTLFTASGVLLLLTPLALAATALAGKPKGEFAVFASCPVGTAGVNTAILGGTSRFAAAEAVRKSE